MPNEIQLTVDGRAVAVPDGTKVIEACARAGVKVPSLCALPGVCLNASCGVCLVEVAGAKSLLRSCVQDAAPGMQVLTASKRALEARRTVVELLLANHPADCLGCLRNGSCELQSLAELVGARPAALPRTRPDLPIDAAGAALIRDPNKCVLCGRCVAVCREVQSVSAIDFVGRGARTRVAPFLDKSLALSVCTSCGQCSLVCPTGALTERDESAAVLDALRDPERTVVVQTAPAIRASLGEALGLGPGNLATGKLVAGLRRLGFAKVFDTDFTADLTILEEGNELLKRLGSGGVLPMITSCSPGWINFIETFYPKLLPHLSTCKSPQQMFGALAKTFWAERAGIDPAKLTVVSIMPCTAKKAEARRPEMRDAWDYWKKKGKPAAAYDDVDFALTTRELARLFRRVGIDFASLPDEAFDDPLGASTGAAVIFGSSGGVMEAAVRSVYELVVKQPLPSLELAPLRGLDGVKSADLDLAGTKLKVAVSHSLKNARVLLDEIAAGKSPYAFIEVMSCPGGCIGGGGQPISADPAARQKRQEAIYAEDRRLPLRKSHDNSAVKALYADFLGEPLGHLSHELLHTSYARKEV
jgi:iron-only hydrogenase group A